MRFAFGRADARRERGFTLIEALIALVIVGVAATATMEAFGAGFRGEALAGRQLEAAALAEARMNELAFVAADSVTTYTDGRTGRFAPPFEEYAWRAHLRRDEASPSLIRATVDVEWRGGAFALETMLYRPQRWGAPPQSAPPVPPAAR